jgi:alkylated DNA repair dioxygenase AlkB
VLGIRGLTYLPDLLSVEEQLETLQAIDARPWQNDLKRRVQHYGYKYDYKARTIDRSMFVGPLPPFAIQVAKKLQTYQLLEETPDQVIVNEYQPGQGITAHVDCEPCFKDTIATVSLGSTYEMDFICLATNKVVSALLETGSALVLRGEARYEWMHRIQARMKDKGLRRGRRVSLTFRNVILH